MTRAEMAETAALIRRVLDRVDAGELEAETREELGMVRRLEGAAVALEQAAGTTGPAT